VDELRHLRPWRRLLWGRIATAFDQVYGMRAMRNEFVALGRLSPEQYRAYWDLVNRVQRTIEGGDAPADKLRALAEGRDEAMRMGTPWYALRVQFAAAPFELQRGQPARHRAILEGGIARCRELQEHFLLCQYLGELGWTHAIAGEDDSCRVRFAEALAVARRHGFLEHEARILRFEASLAREQGRLALAADRMAEAHRVCDVPQAGSARLRLELEEAKFYADLGCWDLAARSLRRLPPLIRQFPHATRSLESHKHALEAGWLGARVAFAEGDVARGEQLMRACCDSIAAPDGRIGFARVFDSWSDGLLACGRPAEALAVCERGLAHCDTAHVPERTGPLLVRRAQALQRLGHWGESAAAVHAASAFVREHRTLPGSLAREVGVLEAHELFRRGGSHLARAHLQRVLDAFVLGVDAGRSGSQSYLELESALPLRDAIHQWAGLSPEQGYAFECAWRALEGRAAAGRPSRVVLGTAPTPPADHRPPRHLVYHFLPDRLLRWTATRAGVRLDTLALDADSCLSAVRRCRSLLVTEPLAPGRPMGAESSRALRSLARRLLPPGLARDLAGDAMLAISPDGPLAALPFEALLVPAPGGERPLAAIADVAYLHAYREAHTSAREPAPAAPPVIVADPRLAPELRHRYAAGLLDVSSEEIAFAHRRWPGAVALTGAAVTKDALLRRLERARAVYLAAHHVHDPDSPFLGFVPLAAPPGAPPEASVLEIADVRALDLTPCEVVVLASCASGAPYRLATRPGPSLGDAFLDAGAHAVIQSSWDVGSPETAVFMRAFLAASQAGGSPVVALGRARRAVMATPGGASPRVWAAWSARVLWPPAPAREASAPAVRLRAAVVPARSRPE
jgi:hypothetical protein